MATNGSHKELIKTGNFVKKFRNPLRNYYTYGFFDYRLLNPEKSEENSSDSEKAKKKISTTFRDDWNRLNNILKSSEYFEWSDSPSGILFLSNESQSQNVNPFHRVYKFCISNVTDITNFFNIILALSDKYELAERLYSVTGETEDENRPYYPAIRTVSKEELEMLSSSEKITKTQQSHSLENSKLIAFQDGIQERHLTTSQLAVFCPLFGGFLNKENKALWNYCQFLKQLGILKEAVSKKPVQWKLSDVTMKKSLSCCGDKTDNFLLALDFFSRYYVMGELGSFLLSRCHYHNKNFFAFKHEYFAQALNDYVLADLLYAINHNLWCKIRQSNIMKGTKSEFLCRPIQLRFSQMNGRQHVCVYEPFQRSYYNIRLEFIEEVVFVEHIIFNGSCIDDENNPVVLNDIENAKEALQYSWGVSTTKKQTGNVISPVKRQKVQLTIDCQEYYILNKLKHEIRNGEIKVENGLAQVTIEVTDAMELRPWIRTLYSKIRDFSGINSENFTLEDDVNELLEGKIKISKASPSETVCEFPADNIDCSIIGYSESEMLFNPILGIYHVIWGDILTAVYDKKQERSIKNCISEKQVMTCIDKVLAQREPEAGSATIELLTTNSDDSIKATLPYFLKVFYMRKHTFNPKWKKHLPLRANRSLFHVYYYQKYISLDEADLYRDVIPLSVLEIKWLKAILKDEKMNLFLDEEHIQKILNMLPEDTETLDVSSIVYYDRYKSEDEAYQLNSDIFQKILKAIDQSQALDICYQSKKGQSIKGIYYPVMIEYSKRDDVFRLFLQCKADSKIYEMNCERILSCELTEEVFKYCYAKARLDKFRQKMLRQVTLEFQNIRNIPDRILSEFSPWKKECRYHKETGIYTLTIYYNKKDELDLVTRILGYGAGVRVTDENHPVYQEIMKRLTIQAELFRNRNIS